MKWYFILLIVIIVLLILTISLIISVSLYITNHICRPRLTTKEEYLGFFKEKGIDSWFSKLERNPIEFHLSDGYTIHGDYNLVDGSRKYVIIVHGHATNKEASLIYASAFNELGFSTIIYDQRGHGDNEKYDIKMGSQESKDLDEIIRQVYEKFGSDIYLGLHGLSMGAATVMLVLKYTQNLKFVVEDCGYDDFKKTIIVLLNKYHLWGKFFIPFIDLTFKIRFGFWLKEVKPIDVLVNNQVPLLFIHGNKDIVVPFESMNNLYTKATSIKEKREFDAPHARSLVFFHDEYLDVLKKFLKEIEK